MDGLPLLRPEEQVLEAMMDGWRNPQLARNLALSMIEKRAVRLRAFFALRPCRDVPVGVAAAARR